MDRPLSLPSTTEPHHTPGLNSQLSQAKDFYILETFISELITNVLLAKLTAADHVSFLLIWKHSQKKQVLRH